MPKSDNLKFLQDFNLTPCNINLRRENQADLSNCFLDAAFNGKNTKNNIQEDDIFKTSIKNFISKFPHNLSISSLNINSIGQKFQDILFLLNEQLVDILVIN